MNYFNFASIDNHFNICYNIYQKERSLLYNKEVLQMKIKIDVSLKRLRTKHGITQEVLADFIGVSAQAVSKWERGDGYPDIELLPSIANYFGVSLDELMSMDEFRDTEKLDELMNKHRTLRSTVGKAEEDVDLLHQILSMYPNNYAVMRELAECTPDLEESLKLCNKILEFCTDNEIRSYAAYQECSVLAMLGRKEEALAKANKLADMEHCREINTLWLLDAKDRARECQNTISLIVWAFYSTLEQLEDSGSYTPEERLTIYKKTLDFVSLVYDTSELYSSSIYVYKCNLHSALICLDNGMIDRAIPYVKEALRHAKTWDNLPSKGKYSSLLTNQLEFDLLSVGKGDHTLKEDIVKSLERRIDKIKDNDEFMVLFNEITS